jgi:hypothetical protein
MRAESKDVPFSLLHLVQSIFLTSCCLDSWRGIPMATVRQDSFLPLTCAMAFSSTENYPPNS